MDDDDEEDSAPGMTSHEQAGLQRPGSPGSSSGVESEGSYAEVYSDDSYHSDGDEIAEMWDPYCTYLIEKCFFVSVCGLASYLSRSVFSLTAMTCKIYVCKGGCI